MQAIAKQAPIKVNVRKPKGIKVNVNIKVGTAQKDGQVQTASIQG